MENKICLAFIISPVFSFFNYKRGIQFSKYSLRENHVKEMTPDITGKMMGEKIGLFSPEYEQTCRQG